MNECEKLSIEDLLRLVFFEGGLPFYSSCDSAMISLQDAFRSTILMGTDGLPVLSVRADNGLLCWHEFNLYRAYVIGEGGIVEDDELTKEFICYLISN